MSSDRDDVDEFLREAFSQMTRSNADHKHPFRYVTLATTDADSIKQRTVVHRKFVEPGISHICTDGRTRKLTDIGMNPKVSLLFYHPKKKFQIAVQAHAETMEGGELYEQYRSQIAEHQLIDYASIPEPGAEIEESSSFERGESINLSLLVLEWYSIDVLQLDRAGHRRAKFRKAERGWNGTWIVP